MRLPEDPSPSFPSEKTQSSTISSPQSTDATTSNSSRCVPPVIGILAHPYRWNETKDPFFVAASYVKWLECAGARTIAIPLDATSEYLDDIFTQINMVFLPGGDMPYPAEILNYLLDKVCQSNLEGHYFPVWGTCLGFQQIVEYVAGRGQETVLRWDYETKGISWALQEVVQENSELYKDPEMYHAVTATRSTFHTNRGGITPETFLANTNLTKRFHITSVNYDRKGLPFVSTIEPKSPESFPFYGVQFHPEKNSTEYGFFPDMPLTPYQDIDHSPTGVRFSLTMAQFVVNLARKSLEQNANLHQYKKPHLYPPMYTYRIESQAPRVTQIYVVPKLDSCANKRRRLNESGNPFLISFDDISVPVR